MLKKYTSILIIVTTLIYSSIYTPTITNAADSRVNYSMYDNSIIDEVTLHKEFENSMNSALDAAAKINWSPSELQTLDMLRIQPLKYLHFYPPSNMTYDNTLSIENFNIAFIESALSIKVDKTFGGYNYNDLDDMIKSNNYDLISLIVFSDANYSNLRSKVRLTDSYSTEYLWAVSTHNITSMEDFKGKRIAVNNLIPPVHIQDFYNLENVLFLDADLARNMLDNDNIDVFITYSSALPKLTKESPYVFCEIDFSLVNPKSQLITNSPNFNDLNEIINKLYTPEVMEQFHNYDYYLDEYKKDAIFINSLTQEEKAYLKNTSSIKIAFQQAPSLMELDTFSWIGYINDITEKLQNLTGKNVLIVDYSNRTYSDMLHDLDAGIIDIIPYTDEHISSNISSSFSMTDPYLTYPLEVLRTKNTSSIRNIDDILFYKIGYLNSQETFIRSYLDENLNNTNSRFYGFNTIEDLNSAIKDGYISYIVSLPGMLPYNALAGNNDVVDAYLMHNNTTQPTNLRFIVRTDDTELLSIINKGLSTIDQDFLTSKWITLSLDNNQFSMLVSDNNRLYTWLVLLAILVLSALIWLSLYIRKVNSTNKSMYKLDHLTKLYNRNMLAHDLKTKSSFYIVILDVNRFKSINELWGYDNADLVLKQIANRLRNLDLSKKYSFYRISGNEFALLIEMPNDVDLIRDMLDYIYNYISSPYIIKNSSVKIEFSIGVTHSDYFNESISDALSYPELMVKQNKLSSEPYSIFNIDDTKNMEDFFNIEKVFNDNADETIVAYYQPLINLTTNKVVGCEMLARLIIDDKVYSPKQFIPIARQTNYLDKIDASMLLRAIKMRALLLSNVNISEDFFFSMNFSANFLRLISPEYLDNLKSIHGLTDFSFLQVEVIEELADNELLKANLETLKSYGFKLAIDDFIASSNFTRIDTNLFDCVKLDSSLAPIKVDKNTTFLMEMVVSLLKNFDIDIISKNVESEEYNNLIKELEVDIAQGYLYSRALPFEELLRFLLEYK